MGGGQAAHKRALKELGVREQMVMPKVTQQLKSRGEARVRTPSSQDASLTMEMPAP